MVGRPGADTKIACAVDPATPPEQTPRLGRSRMTAVTMAPPDDGGREARTAGLTKQNDSRESQWRHPTLARGNRCTDGNHVMHNMIITRKLTRTGRQSATHAHVSAERGRGEKDLPPAPLHLLPAATRAPPADAARSARPRARQQASLTCQISTSWWLLEGPQPGKRGRPPHRARRSQL